MNRLIVPKTLAHHPLAPAAAGHDDAIARLVKYVPAEVIAGYTLFSGIVSGAAKGSPLEDTARWLVFASGVLLTPLYLWKTGKPRGVQWWHLPISTVSFVVWAYALGGPFVGVQILGHAYESWFAALLAGLFSWGIALVWNPTEPSAPAVAAGEGT